MDDWGFGGDDYGDYSLDDIENVGSTLPSYDNSVDFGNDYSGGDYANDYYDTYYGSGPEMPSSNWSWGNAMEGASAGSVAGPIGTVVGGIVGGLWGDTIDNWFKGLFSSDSKVSSSDIQVTSDKTQTKTGSSPFAYSTTDWSNAFSNAPISTPSFINYNTYGAGGSSNASNNSSTSTTNTTDNTGTIGTTDTAVDTFKAENYAKKTKRKAASSENSIKINPAELTSSYLISNDLTGEYVYV